MQIYMHDVNTAWIKDEIGLEVNMKLDIGIIGCGAVSKLHIDTFKEIGGTEIKAVSDIMPDNVSKTGRLLGVDFYNNYRELLGRDDISVVSICTPSGLHEEIAVEEAILLIAASPRKESNLLN